MNHSVAWMTASDGFSENSFVEASVIREMANAGLIIEFHTVFFNVTAAPRNNVLPPMRAFLSNSPSRYAHTLINSQKYSAAAQHDNFKQTHSFLFFESCEPPLAAYLAACGAVTDGCTVYFRLYSGCPVQSVTADARLPKNKSSLCTNSDTQHIEL